MKIKTLNAEESQRQGGATAVAIITHVDLTETAVTTAQVLDIESIAAGSIARGYGIQVVTGLEDASDSAFDDITVELGDDDDADRFVAAAQVAANNGSVVSRAADTGTKLAYSAAKTLKLTLTPETGKALANVDAGELRVFYGISDPSAP